MTAVLLQVRYVLQEDQRRYLHLCTPIARYEGTTASQELFTPMKLTELKSTFTPPFQSAGRFGRFSHGWKRLWSQLDTFTFKLPNAKTNQTSKFLHVSRRKCF